MAGGDYKSCDVCHGKTYYDADVEYEESYLGPHKALCTACDLTHDIVIIRKTEADENQATEDTLG